MDLDLIKRAVAWFVASTVQTKAAYAASGTTATISILTFNQVVGAVGVALSVLIAAFTAWSNHGKNKAIIKSLDDKESARQVDQANG